MRCFRNVIGPWSYSSIMSGSTEKRRPSDWHSTPRTDLRKWLRSGYPEILLEKVGLRSDTRVGIFGKAREFLRQSICIHASAGAVPKCYEILLW